MSAQRQIQLATSPQGRIALHLICLLRDHRWSWHLHGVWREVRSQALRHLPSTLASA